MSNDLIEKCAEKPTWAAQRIERLEAEQLGDSDALKRRLLAAITRLEQSDDK